MEFGLLWRALSRHKAIVAVMVLEFAVTLAILSNALALASARVAVLQTPSGIRESGLIIAAPMGIGPVSNFDNQTYDALRDLAANQPGVQSVSVIGAAPLSGGDRWNGIVSSAPGITGHPIDVAIYTGDLSMPRTMGLALTAGRWFTSEEVLPATNFPDASHVHLLQLTDSLARKLFTGTNPVGKTVYFDGSPVTVVGVLASLSRPGYHGGNLDQDSVILPTRTALAMGPALGIRMREDWEGSTDLAIKAIREVLNRRTQGSVAWSVQSYKALRDGVFSADRAALGLLAAILVAVTGVSVNGIAASSGYWVHQRVRQTWIRRALGATRSQVVAYFMAENAIICGFGVVFGIGLGLAVNFALIDYLHLSRMPVQSLIVGAALAVLIGQLAVLRSAIKTARRGFDVGS